MQHSGFLTLKLENRVLSFSPKPWLASSSGHIKLKCLDNFFLVSQIEKKMFLSLSSVICMTLSHWHNFSCERGCLDMLMVLFLSKEGTVHHSSHSYLIHRDPVCQTYFPQVPALKV